MRLVPSHIQKAAEPLKDECASKNTNSAIQDYAQLPHRAFEKIPAKILLIAGPSGAGKSTFIDQLITGRLSDEIRQWLPEGVKDWPSFETNDLLKRGNLAGFLDAASGSVGGLICHYDTFLALRYGLASPSDDPVWPVFREAQSLFIVSIEPSYEQLRSQFLTRFNRQMSNKGLLRRTWHRYGNMLIKRSRYLLLGKGVPDTAWIYRSEKQVRDWYAKWDASLQMLVENSARVKILSLEPAENSPSQYTYSIKTHDGD